MATFDPTMLDAVIRTMYEYEFRIVCHDNHVNSDRLIILIDRQGKWVFLPFRGGGK